MEWCRSTTPSPVWLRAVVDLREANRHAVDGAGFLELLKGRGIDTSAFGTASIATAGRLPLSVPQTAPVPS
jgi:hypothetical protein